MVAEGKMMQIKTVLVATDFSQDADAAIEAGLEIARAFGSKVEIFHAYYVDVPAVYAGFGNDFAMPQDVLDPISKGAQASMDAVLDRVSGSEVEVTGRVEMERPVKAILGEAERILADMIVMGTRGLSGLEHLVLGSTADRVIRMAQCPVLTIRSKP
jgi:nucleotide-binding universal stress UspA family protein